MDRDDFFVFGDKHTCFLADWFSLQDSENVLQRLVDTLQELVDVASRVAGHVAADPVVMDAVADAKPVWHHRGEAAEAHGRTGEGAGGEDVVVDGSVGGVCVQAVQSLALWVGQVSHGEQVTVKTLSWWEE